MAAVAGTHLNSSEDMQHSSYNVICTVSARLSLSILVTRMHACQVHHLTVQTVQATETRCLGQLHKDYKQS